MCILSISHALTPTSDIYFGLPDDDTWITLAFCTLQNATVFTTKTRSVAINIASKIITLWVSCRLGRNQGFERSWFPCSHGLGAVLTSSNNNCAGALWIIWPVHT